MVRFHTNDIINYRFGVLHANIYMSVMENLYQVISNKKNREGKHKKVA